MITFSRILCPTDLTPESDESLRYGVALASAYHAKLLLLYCNDDGAGSGHNEDPVPSSAMFTASIAPHLGMTTFSELNWEGLIVQKRDGIGETIVREATKHDVDLIVIRSRRRPRAAALLGSTAETISRTAPCPVLVIHPREREWVSLSSGQIDLQRILVAYDFSQDSKLALNYGISLAQEYKTELHLLHVLTADAQEPDAAWSQLSNESAIKTALPIPPAVAPEGGLSSRVINAIRRGKPYDEILTYARDHEIDLICMGASGAGATFGEIFGSNVDRVLRQAPCPVFIARPFDVVLNQLLIQTKYATNHRHESNHRIH